MTDFVHLHVHSEFSLLDGLAKMPDLVSRAKELGMKSIALTDHGAMYGVIKFYKEAINQGIKPIIGVETYLAKRNRLDKQGSIDTDPYHLVLLAKNNKGYKNLMKIVSIAHLEGFYYKPRIDDEILQKYHEGIIALSGCIQGEIPSLIKQKETRKVKERALFYQETFGEGNFYLELQKHPKIKELEEINEKIVSLSKELGIPLVATNDAHYVNEKDAEAQEILLCVQTQRTILDKNRPLSMISSPDFYLKNQEEMLGQFIRYPESIDNTVKIAEKCQVEIPLGNWILPQFPVPVNETPGSYLNKLCEEKISIIFPKITPEIKNRLDYELSIIDKKGYATYFLIVSDFVNWAKGQGIAVGPGRGSAAGSLVAYSLGITGLNPFFFNLPFERFLNPQRPSPPDIDLDFADNRRDEVIAYVTKKYGDDKVAQIITFGTMEARQAIRDAGRALGMPYSGPDRISKMIPPGAQGFPMTIDKALQIVPELFSAYQNENETKRLLDLASKLEGVARHASTHAAGVVIADKPLEEYTPLQKETKGERIITQYDMYSVGEGGIGLLKMDFLGLRNLTIIQQALKFIKETENIDIDLPDIPLNDKKTYHLLSSGETTGVFQLESSGMRRYVKELKPSTIFDLMAMVALFRPGPMQVIPEFIARKHNADLIKYPHPKLKEVLKESYGLITYQDDVLLTAITLAGYSWGDADKLRKAVGKKIPAEMKKQKEQFIKGCVSNNISQEKAEEIFKLIEPFAGYGFNKAHAACYGTIAYQTAYLKAHYPVEFMTALLSAETHNSGPTRDEKLARAVEECKRMKIIVLPPDINKSDTEFTIEKNTGQKRIRFGLSAIKNVGPAAIESMLTTRKTKGEFKSIGDFCSRVDLSKVNRKTLESLIKTGALDVFGKRAVLLVSLDNIIEESHKFQRQNASGQTNLFNQNEETSGLKLELKEVEELSREQLLIFERELLGFFLTAHPYASELAIAQTQASHKIVEITLEEHTGKNVVIAGLVSHTRKIMTKVGNNEMVFAQIDDLTGNIEVVVFPKTYQETKEFWLSDKVIIVTGKISDRNDRLSLIVNSVSAPVVSPLSEEEREKEDEEEEISDNFVSVEKKIIIPQNTSVVTLKKIKNVLQENPGNDKIILILKNGGTDKEIELNFGVKLKPGLREKIGKIIEEDKN